MTFKEYLITELHNDNIAAALSDSNPDNVRSPHNIANHYGYKYSLGKNTMGLSFNHPDGHFLRIINSKSQKSWMHHNSISDKTTKGDSLHSLNTRLALLHGED